MLQVSVGQAEHADTVHATTLALEHAATRLRGPPDAAFVLADAEYDHERLLEAIASRYPGLPMVDCTTSVLFTDFVGFTATSGVMEAADLVAMLDYYFSGFDAIIERHGLEKLKTISDAYMCVGGVPHSNDSHVIDTVRAAWDICHFLKHHGDDGPVAGQRWQTRVGVHTGPLVAGVIGTNKFAYDVWGQTVNIAARMERMSAPNRVDVSAATASALAGAFELEARGAVEVKGLAPIDMFYVVGPSHG